MSNLPTKRRLFITENSKDFFKLFNVKQGSEKADFYFTWPDSGNTKFVLFDTWKQEKELRALDASNNGRLSFHASGQVHFAEEGIKAREEFVVKGNQLFNPDKNEKLCLIFGNEINGVSDAVIALADVALEIPQAGTKHSLNISVCLGIVVWTVSQFGQLAD